MNSPESVTTESVSEWAWLARIRKPQGRKGEVFADILTDFPDKFAERRQLWLIHSPDRPAPKTASAARPIELANHWPHKGGIVLHFAGVESITAAETLAGLIVAIPQEQRVPLPEDEVYIADLIGCTLVDVGAAPPACIGLIENVDRSSGAVALLVVKSPSGEVLVPFAKSYLRNIDLAGKRLEMALPEGLVDLNLSGKPQD